MRNLIAKTRPLLSITLLACSMTLVACIDDSCGITSPSEATGSHEDTGSNTAGDNVVVLVHYDSAGVGPSSVNVSSSRGGSVVVQSPQFAGLVLFNMKKGDQVFFTVSTSTGIGLRTQEPCTWTGKGRIFGDAALTITAVQRSSLNPIEYLADCTGWR